MSNVRKRPLRDTATGDDTTVVELPAPTAFPLFTALGITLLFAGLVTHVFVSAAGVLFATYGVIGWLGEVLPEERVEAVEVRPPNLRAAVIKPRPAAVAALEPGVSGHRVRVPAEIHPYRAGAVGGAAGAAAMAVTACLYGLLAHASPWYPVNLLAASAMPSLASATAQQLAAFHPTALAVALIIHSVVSLLVGLLYAALLPTLPGHPMLWGGAIAPLLWSGLLWSAMGVIDPALADRVRWSWFALSQSAFGFITGATIVRMERIETLQTWPLAARAGIESSDNSEAGEVE